MTTIEIIDDKRFKLKNDGKRCKCGFPSVEHLGCKWTLKFHDNSLTCTANDSNLWSVDAELKFTITMRDKKKTSVVEEVTTRFDATNTECKMEKENVAITKLECIVEIKAIHGILYKATYSGEKDENINNTALIVEGKELYISKQILAMASPVFHAMFYSGFKESTADKVPIQDVKYDHMKQFLAIVYQSHFVINAENIEALLELADRFDAALVMRRCQRYLMNATPSEVKTEQKLIYSEKYRLSKLQAKVFDTIGVRDLKELIENADKFGEATVREMLKHTLPTIEDSLSRGESSVSDESYESDY